jgi:UDP-N-acetylmuramoyl-L-alanyl-D-glutamate--2,6-diaminopimelate ligase
MSAARLSSLVSEAGLRPEAQTGDAGVEWATADSRAVRAGSLFVCMPSKSTDTHGYLEAAKAEGAVAAVAHSSDGFARAVSLGLAAVWFPPTQPVFNVSVAKLVRGVFRDPSTAMRVVGVTGTNGKTTTAWMLRDALRAMGRKASYMGTLGFDPGGNRRELANTTPFPVETWQLLQEAR